MATVKTCDICGKPALGIVRVEINAENASGNDTKSGIAYEMDSCASCRPAAVSQMATNASIALEKGIALEVVRAAAAV